MNFTHTQKKYLKENVHKKSVAEMASELRVNEKDILNFFKERWPEEKYKRMFEGRRLNQPPAVNTTQMTNTSLIEPFWKWFIRNRLGILILTLLVTVTYINTYNAVFLSDDLPGIVRNPDVGNFSSVGKYGISFFPYLINAITVHIGGFVPFAFRIRSILMHLGSTYVLFYLGSFMISPVYALIIACIFAIHPILIESVTWISAFSYPAYAFFILCAFTCYYRSRKTNFPIIWSYVFFTIALLLSEKAIIFPVILVLSEIAFFDIRKNWLKTLPYFAISVVYALLIFGNISQRVNSFTTDFYSAPEFINPFIMVPLSITHYLELIFWPGPLTIYHSEIRFEIFDYILRLLFFILYLAGILYAYFKNRIVFFWLSFFLICLAPTLLPLTITWLVAERYAYLATIGIIFVVVYFLMKLAKNKTMEPFVYLFIGLVMISFTVRSIVRNIDWNTEDNLYIATGKTSPSNPVTHNNLGDVYGRHGDYQQSIAEFKKAIELNPGYADAYHNMGNIYRISGQTDLALQSYQKALQINPRIWQTYENIGSIYYDKKDYKTAIAYLLKSIQISPYPQPDLYVNLGIIYLQSGDKANAKKAFQIALSLQPDNKLAQQGLNSASQ